MRGKDLETTAAGLMNLNNKLGGLAVGYYSAVQWNTLT